MISSEHFSPLDYGFSWTDDGWYNFDGKLAAKAALKARNTRAKDLAAKGHTVRKGSLGKQLVSRGGIGSGRPHIELVVPVYSLTIVS